MPCFSTAASTALNLGRFSISFSAQPRATYRPMKKEMTEAMSVLDCEMESLVAVAVVVHRDLQFWNEEQGTNERWGTYDRDERSPPNAKEEARSEVERSGGKDENGAHRLDEGEHQDALPFRKRFEPLEKIEQRVLQWRAGNEEEEKESCRAKCD